MNRSNKKDDSGPCYLFGGEVFLLMDGQKGLRTRMMKLAAIAAAIMFHVVCAIAQPQPPAVEWERTYGADDDVVISDQIKSDEGYVFGGTTAAFNARLFDFWLLKTDMSGDCLWSRGYGGESMEECFSITQATDGGYMLAGYTLSYGSGGQDFWLLKTDANGDSQWSRTYGGNNHDACTDVLRTFD
ncbi:hypothetical protein EHM69_08175, partial [candidate division KSB1 bacterium]